MNVDRQSVEDGVREAEARALEYNPKDRVQLVRDSIARVDQMKAAGASEEDIEKEVGPFKEQFPFLYKMVIKPNYDKATLKTMLVMLDKMGDGSMSQHQASVLIGGRLVDKYVKPDLR